MNYGIDHIRVSSF